MFCVAGVLAGILAGLAAGPAPAQGPDKFAACAAKMGKEFRQARDEFLAIPADQTKTLLEQKLDSDSWQERLAARVLLGWQEHKADYQQLLQAPRLKNQKGDTHYAWGTGDGAIKAADVPLMYELLLKSDDPDAARDAADVLVALAQSRPDTPLDVRLLHRFLRDRPGNAAPRKTVAWLLGSLPAKYQDKDELLKSLKAELGRKDRDHAVAESLVAGFSRAAEKLSARDRDQLVKDLVETEGLKEYLGKVLLTYAVGNIGGDQASEQLAQYLEKASDDVEQRWALRALGRSNSDTGTRFLIQFVDDRNLAQAVRGTAIEALGRAKWLPKVGEKLQAIALDTQAPEGQRIQALRSLETISAHHPKEKDLQKQIKEHIETISASAPKNDNVRKELQDILDRMKEEKP
jgi:HEAT repeat protein